MAVVCKKGSIVVVMVETAKEVGVCVYDPHVVTVVGIASRPVVVLDGFARVVLMFYTTMVS
jgi:hypothetical protein